MKNNTDRRVRTKVIVHKVSTLHLPSKNVVLEVLQKTHKFCLFSAVVTEVHKTIFIVLFDYYLRSFGGITSQI